MHPLPASGFAENGGEVSDWLKKSGCDAEGDKVKQLTEASAQGISSGSAEPVTHDASCDRKKVHMSGCRGTCAGTLRQTSGETFVARGVFLPDRQ